MVCRTSGNYGEPFQAGRGITQGGPLSAKLFNILVDAVAREWMREVQEGSDGNFLCHLLPRRRISGFSGPRFPSTGAGYPRRSLHTRWSRDKCAENPNNDLHPREDVHPTPNGIVQSDETGNDDGRGMRKSDGGVPTMSQDNKGKLPPPPLGRPTPDIPADSGRRRALGGMSGRDLRSPSTV